MNRCLRFVPCVLATLSFALLLALPPAESATPPYGGGEEVEDGTELRFFRCIPNPAGYEFPAPSAGKAPICKPTQGACNTVREDQPADRCEWQITSTCERQTGPDQDAFARFEYDFVMDSNNTTCRCVPRLGADGSQVRTVHPGTRLQCN